MDHRETRVFRGTRTFLRDISPKLLYKIDCSNCDASYVGTKKLKNNNKLKNRISEYRNHIKRNSKYLLLRITD